MSPFEDTRLVSTPEDRPIPPPLLRHDLCDISGRERRIAIEARMGAARGNTMKMHRNSTRSLGGLVILLAILGCEEVGDVWIGAGPAPPENLQVWYYAGSVNLEWELHPSWDGEVFRVYGKRRSDRDYSLVAESSSCSDGICSHADRNVAPDRIYEYYVSSYDLRTGDETSSDVAVEVFVPDPEPPPAPGDIEAIPLDDAIWLVWNSEARTADDFSFYRVYIEGGDGEVVFLGETDSEGFVDLLVQNGSTYGYFVTSVDDQGHESQGSFLAEGTPRPDYRGEFLWAHEDRPDASGFRFRDSGEIDPVVSGTDPDRHFRIEIDEQGWWLVPGPGVQVHPDAFATTDLRCGPAADAGCTDLREAPESGWDVLDLALTPGYSYLVRVPAGGGEWRYGTIRVSHTGFAQDGALVIFDWAFQLQAGNPSLLLPGGMVPIGP